MRRFLVLAALPLTACSLETPSDPTRPLVPVNPLVAMLASEGGTYAMTRLGTQTEPPYLLNDVVCSDGLRRYDEVADTIYFAGDGTYRRVYHNHSLIWQTIGVPEPRSQMTHSSFELRGTIAGEGDVLFLLRSDPRAGVVRTPFEIDGEMLLKPEALGVGCRGERVNTQAAFSRVAG